MATSRKLERTVSVEPRDPTAPTAFQRRSRDVVKVNPPNARRHRQGRDRRKPHLARLVGEVGKDRDQRLPENDQRQQPIPLREMGPVRRRAHLEKHAPQPVRGAIKKKAEPTPQITTS